MITVKKAQPSQYGEIEEIYARARSYMRENGNATQWGSVYPPREVILSDIESGNLYVLFSDRIEGVFAFVPGEDPTYRIIEGEWQNALEYCAVHRVASAGRIKGMLKAVMDYCFTRCPNIKIDTHENNVIMQHQLEKYGFKRCGIIRLENGEPRIAYQMTKE
ncbi:MAG: GNAT family N-acetyltransferase [Ruminococcaceae bacterium]|nr:GNAT family N-acetyltransferase [Oscillospiraceae bacterium]